MSKLIPPPIHDVAAEFDGLPGVGPRAALRYAYWLVNQPKEKLLRFSDALRRLADGVARCHICGLWSDASPCSICTDPRRSDKELCVVASAQDVRVIEESGAFKGRYHILGGTLDPVSGRTPENLYIPSLIERLLDASSKTTEVILAFDPDIPGDTTVLYLKKKLTDRDFGRPLRVTRLARGLPNGATLEYADEMTVAEALEHRRES